MTDTPKSQGLAPAKKMEAPAIPASPKNGKGKQRLNVASEVNIATTEAPVVFQLSIRPPNRALFRLQPVSRLVTEHRRHPNTSGT
jgi:hypothetical protein